MRKRLIGLTTADYIHPYEMSKKDVFESQKIQTAIDSINTVCMAMMNTFINGVYVQVTTKTHPRLYEILEDVFDILDFHPNLNVRICICHKTIKNVIPAGDDNNLYLIVSDYILREFDDEMFYYSFGNAVAMIKAGHMKIATISAYVPSLGVFDAVKMPVTEYIHAADATSDRGGLLACQSFRVAAKCHLFALGVPAKTADTLLHTEAQMVYFIAKYKADYEKASEDLGSVGLKIGKFFYDVAAIEGADNLMLCDLFDWYCDGYANVMKMRSGGRIL